MNSIAQPPSAAPAGRRARPAGVTLIAIGSFLVSFFFLCLGFSVFFLRYASGPDGERWGVPGPPYSVGHDGFLGPARVLFFLSLVAAAIFLINAIGLLKLQNWARWLTIVLVLLHLAHAIRHTLASFLFLRPIPLLLHAAILALSVWVIAYFFRPHVTQAFRAS